MQIIAVVNQKGGVGKTTSVANLGAALAMRGNRVVLVDLDPQGHLSISFDGMPEPGEPSVYTLMRGEHEMAEVVRETGIAGLRLAPANLDLAGAESELSGEIGREIILRQALEAFGEQEGAPEVVLLDCPPSLGLLSLNALVASRWVIIPLQAEFFALQGMAQLLDVLERVRRRLNPRLEVLGLLVGLYSKARNLSREVLTELREHFGDLVFNSLVRMNVRLAEAPSHAATIFQYAPSSGGAEDFRAAAEEAALRLGLTAAEPVEAEPVAPAPAPPPEEAAPAQAAAETPRPAAAEVPAAREIA